MVEENKTEESNEQKWLIKIAFSSMENVETQAHLFKP
jgi:hypothetical protein